MTRLEGISLGRIEVGKDKVKIWENSLDIYPEKPTIGVRRLKFFFGGKYSYGTHGKNELFDTNVIPVSEFPVLADFVGRLKTLGVIHEEFDLSQVGVNIYYNQGLSVHRDQIKLFKRPIVSLRLFAPSTLSFGCYGQQLAILQPELAVPLECGTITVMEGFAADCYQHCVRNRDVPGRTAVILLRELQPAFAPKRGHSSSY